MSWQDYVDNQLLASQCVSKAAIAGHDGGIWAKSEGFEVSTNSCHYFLVFPGVLGVSVRPFTLKCHCSKWFANFSPKGGRKSLPHL